jgi:hypothetical protein
VELKRIDSVWYRQLNPADFFNIERTAEAGPEGGGGQGYVDIPTGPRDALFQFLGRSLPGQGEAWPTTLSITAKVIGVQISMDNRVRL